MDPIGRVTSGTTQQPRNRPHISSRGNNRGCELGVLYNHFTVALILAERLQQIRDRLHIRSKSHPARRKSQEFPTWLDTIPADNQDQGLPTGNPVQRTTKPTGTHTAEPIPCPNNCTDHTRGCREYAAISIKRASIAPYLFHMTKPLKPLSRMLSAAVVVSIAEPPTTGKEIRVPPFGIARLDRILYRSRGQGHPGAN